MCIVQGVIFVKLKTPVENTSMSLINEILAVRSLGKDLRDIEVTEETVNAIVKIHDCLRSGSDALGWHKVDWRSRQGNSRAGAGVTQHTHYRGFGGRHHGSHSNTGHPPVSVSMNRTGGTSLPSASRPLPNKYVSRFKPNSEKIDDAIMNTIILGKLNKFSVANYDEIKSFLCQILDSGETNFLKDFMKLVFQKATTEEIFCPLYAKLISELSERYKFLLTEMVILYKEYMAIFEEVSEKDIVNYDELIKRTSEKKYRLGYSQFLAELVKYNVLDRDLLIQTIRTIVLQIPKASKTIELSKIGEEYADCLLKILCALQAGTSEDICAICKIMEDEVSHQIYPYTCKNPENKLTMKARFALLDIHEKIMKNKTTLPVGKK